MRFEKSLENEIAGCQAHFREFINQRIAKILEGGECAGNEKSGSF